MLTSGRFSELVGSARVATSEVERLRSAAQGMAEMLLDFLETKEGEKVLLATIAKKGLRRKLITQEDV